MAREPSGPRRSVRIALNQAQSTGEEVSQVPISPISDSSSGDLPDDPVSADEDSLYREDSLGSAAEGAHAQGARAVARDDGTTRVGQTEVSQPPPASEYPAAIPALSPDSSSLFPQAPQLSTPMPSREPANTLSPSPPPVTSRPLPPATTDPPPPAHTPPDPPGPVHIPAPILNQTRSYQTGGIIGPGPGPPSRWQLPPYHTTYHPPPPPATADPPHPSQHFTTATPRFRCLYCPLTQTKQGMTRHVRSAHLAQAIATDPRLSHRYAPSQTTRPPNTPVSIPWLWASTQPFDTALHLHLIQPPLHEHIPRKLLPEAQSALAIPEQRITENPYDLGGWFALFMFPL